MSELILKPCPFCGEEVQLSHGEIEALPKSSRCTFSKGDYRIEWEIACMNCGQAKVERAGYYTLDAQGSLADVNEEKAKDEVIDLWNRRA